MLQKKNSNGRSIQKSRINKPTDKKKRLNIAHWKRKSMKWERRTFKSVLNLRSMSMNIQTLNLKRNLKRPNLPLNYKLKRKHQLRIRIIRKRRTINQLNKFLKLFLNHKKKSQLQSLLKSLLLKKKKPKERIKTNLQKPSKLNKLKLLRKRNQRSNKRNNKLQRRLSQ